METNQFFSNWLTLMENAFYHLNPEDFRKLEDKIIQEIRSSRRTRLRKLHGTQKKDAKFDGT